MKVDIGGTIHAFTLHLRKAFYVFELIFLNVDDLPLDLQGARAPPNRFYGNFRFVHIGGKLNGDPEQGKETEKHQ